MRVSDRNYGWVHQAVTFGWSKDRVTEEGAGHRKFSSGLEAS